MWTTATTMDGMCHPCAHEWAAAAKAHGRCESALNGISDDPDGVWECSLLRGHAGQHLDGNNGQRW